MQIEPSRTRCNLKIDSDKLLATTAIWCLQRWAVEKISILPVKLAEHTNREADKKENLAEKEYFVAGAAVSKALANLKNSDDKAPQYKWC